MSQEKIIEESPINMCLSEHKFTEDKFNHVISAEELEFMQRLVQKRVKNKTLKDKYFEKHKDVRINGKPVDDCTFFMTMYVNTAYEIGREAGYNNIDHIINSFLDGKEKRGEIPVK